MILTSNQLQILLFTGGATKQMSSSLSDVFPNLCPGACNQTSSAATLFSVHGHNAWRPGLEKINRFVKKLDLNAFSNAQTRGLIETYISGCPLWLPRSFISRFRQRTISSPQR